MDKPSRHGYCTFSYNWSETPLRILASSFHDPPLLFKTIKGEKNVIAALFSAQEMKPKNIICTVNKK
jgi:hypothetical protein